MKMSPEQLARLQAAEKEILREFIRICEKKGLVYWLIGGSLLGAVRHGGFIPWDDDVDVLMPRADYERFRSLALPAGLYLQDMHREKNSMILFAKLMREDSVMIERARAGLGVRAGICIDIFPLDHYPGRLSRAVCLWLFRLAVHYRLRCEFRTGKAGLFHDLAAGLLMRVSRRLFPDVSRLMADYERFVRNTGASGRVFICGGAYGRKDIFPAGWFAGRLAVKFEDLTAAIPSGYEEILRRVYGDYRRLPDPADRHGHHDIVKLVFPAEKNGQQDKKRITINRY